MASTAEAPSKFRVEDIDVDAHPVWCRSWGQVYPTEKLDLDGATFRLYNTEGALEQFLPLLCPYVLIRPEYELTYAYLEAQQHDAEQWPRAALPKFILTGQPGIGKTTFIIYALLRRLQARKPTVIQLDSARFILFDQEGARSFDLLPRYISLIPSGTWVLTDSGSQHYTPHDALSKKQFLLVHTTSPASGRWKQWARQAGATTYLMDVWQSNEIAALLTRLRQMSCRYEVSRGLDIANRYGPCIRTVIQCLEKGPAEEAAHRGRLAVQSNNLVNDVTNVLSGINELDFATANMPSDLIYVRPQSSTERFLHRLHIPTAEIIRSLSQAVLHATTEQQRTFFSLMSQQPSTRVAAGWIYENCIHSRLTQADDSVPGIDQHGQPCDIPTSTNLLAGTKDALRSTSSPRFYWRPGQAGLPGIDAVLRDGSALWLFRATFSSRHSTCSAIEGLNAIAGIIGTHAPDGQPWNWRLVFVGPSEDALQSAQTDHERDVRMDQRWKDVPTFTSKLMFASHYDLEARSVDLERMNALMSQGESILDVDVKEEADDTWRRFAPIRAHSECSPTRIRHDTYIDR